jgi:hypothetical protein
LKFKNRPIKSCFMPKHKKKEVKKTRPTLKEGELPNVEFYSDLRISQPDGDFHKTIITEWFGNRKLLEYHHGYIQWLFPLSEEPGLNDEAYTLSPTEIQIFRKSTEIQKKILESLQMMLDFFGMELKEDGSIERHKYYLERYKHLNKRTNDHNFMRMTRIIKCLCLCGLEKYAVEFVKILVVEIFVEKSFSNQQTSRKSCEKFFIPSLPKQYQEQFFEIITKSRESKNK